MPRTNEHVINVKMYVSVVLILFLLNCIDGETRHSIKNALLIDILDTRNHVYN